MCELERGMEAVRRELEARDSHRAANNHVLRDFLANAADKCRRLRTESKHAQVLPSLPFPPFGTKESVLRDGG